MEHAEALELLALIHIPLYLHLDIVTQPPGVNLEDLDGPPHIALRKVVRPPVDIPNVP